MDIKEFKGTPGPWSVEAASSNSLEVVTEHEVKICDIIADNDEDLLTELEWDNAYLIASAPDLLEALLKAKQLICSLKLSMLAHPDCTEGSEFDDYTSSAQEFEDEAQALVNKALGGAENG